MILRKDLLTGEEFYGRINQNFKYAKNRIKFYNDKANLIRHAKRTIDIRLHRNFIILNDIVGRSKNKVFHKEFLLGKGFSFSCYTHIVTYENKQHYAIYDYVMIPSNDSEVKFIKL